MTTVDLFLVCQFDSLIRTGMTGSHEEVMKKLHISRTMLFELVSYLRHEMRAPIQYNEQLKTYIYTYPPKFYLGDEIISLLSGDEVSYENEDKHEETHDEILEAMESDDISGGVDNDVWYKNSLDDDVGDESLPHDINFHY